jgi:hypothetical protein
MQELWKNHPLYKQGKIELVPTDWVWKYRGTDVLPTTNLIDGTKVDLDTLWKNICEHGLAEPFIIRVGIKNKKFRLESGNHRIQVFHVHGVALIPVTVQVREECGPYAPDVMTRSQHNFDFSDETMVAGFVEHVDTDIKDNDLTNVYLRPSEVFESLKDKVSV